MPYDATLAARMRRLFAHRVVTFEAKRMMGGLCFLVNGKMCVGVEHDRLMVRLDPDIYEAASQREGCAPMDFTGRPMRGFVFVGKSGWASESDLEKWLDLALEFNPRAKSSKQRRE